MAGQFVHTGSGTGLGIIGPGTGFCWFLYRICGRGYGHVLTSNERLVFIFKN